MRIGFEKEIRQGEHSQEDDHQVGDYSNGPQKVRKASFKEGGVPGYPETFLVAGPGLINPDGKEGSESEEKKADVEAQERDFQHTVVPMGFVHQSSPREQEKSDGEKAVNPE
jgi:hypothetical protein